VAKAFSVASWNVEHFKNAQSRVERIVDFLSDQKPDVLAIYEVEGKDIFAEVSARLPKYSFSITEGPQTQEILVGWKNTMTAFFTQKVQFKRGLQALRPGALLTVTVDGTVYPILFLHTKSGDSPFGLGVRDDMFDRAFAFKKTLDRASVAQGLGPRANYIFLGDLNTMGMDYTYVRDRDIDADKEIEKLTRKADARGMRVLSKTSPQTWWGGSDNLPPSALDQVVAADHLAFRQFGGADVAVRGWPEEGTDAQKRTWIRKFSDHALLFFEVQHA